MGSKALLVLVVLLASVLLLSADVTSKDAPKYLNEEFDKNDGDLDTNGLEEMKYHRGWRRGWGGGYYCPYGCCRWNYYGRCWRCCYYPGEHVEAHADAEPHT